MIKQLITGVCCLTLLFSCGRKDKFECDAQNQMAPADDSSKFFIPNAFSPNGDGLNDVFKPWTGDLKSIDFNIYDSDNDLLFHTTDLSASWTGDGNIEGGIALYHYKINAVTNKDNPISRCGDFYAYKCLPDGFDCAKLIFGDQFDPSYPDGFLNGSTREIFVACNP